MFNFIQIKTTVSFTFTCFIQKWSSLHWHAKRFDQFINFQIRFKFNFRLAMPSKISSHSLIVWSSNDLLPRQKQRVASWSRRRHKARFLRRLLSLLDQAIAQKMAKPSQCRWSLAIACCFRSMAVPRSTLRTKNSTSSANLVWLHYIHTNLKIWPNLDIIGKFDWRWRLERLANFRSIHMRFSYLLRWYTFEFWLILFVMNSRV